MLYLLSASAAAEAAHACASAAPSPPLRHDMVLDVSVVDRTGKSVVMTISRRLTMKHVKLLLTSGTVPLLGRGLGPGDVTLQINGVVLADNMKVADLCNAVTLHAYIARAEKADGAYGGASGIIPWLDKADIAVVTMPLGLTFGGDGKKATTLAKKAREALALVGLTVADVLFYARDGGEAAVGNVLREMGKEELEKKAEEERMRGHGTRGRTAAAATATAAAATLVDADCNAHITADGASTAVNRNSVDDEKFNRTSGNSVFERMLEACIKHLRSEKLVEHLQYLGLLKPEECMDVRFESYMLAAAYIWANKGLLMVAIVLSLGLGEDASTSTRDLLLKLRALRDEGASRCYYLLSKPEFLLHTSVLAALNYAVVHASLKWGHTYGGFRFNELGTHVMNLVAKYVAVAIDPKASGLFDDAYAYAKPLGFEHAVDNLAKNYTKELIEYIINRYDYVLCLPWSHSFFFDKDRRAPYARALGRQLWPPAAASTVARGAGADARPTADDAPSPLSTKELALVNHVEILGLLRSKPLRDAVDMVALEGEPGGIVAGGELPSILYEALAKKFCSYKVDNAHSEVMVKILKWVIAEGHTLPGHRDARFGNTASENDVSTYLLEHYPDGSPQLEAARAEARSDVAPKKRPRATREESTSSVEDLVSLLEPSQVAAAAAHGLNSYAASSVTAVRSLKRGELSAAVHSLVAHLKNLGENAALAEAATCPSCGAAAVPCRPGTSSSNTHDHACVCYACWRKLHATGSNCVVCGEAFSGLELPGGRFEVCPQLMDLTTGTALGDTTNAGAAAETTTNAPATAATKKKAVGMCKCCEKLEIQTPAQGPFATHNAATCPLNPDVGVPKAPGPKKRRADPSAIPYEVGSCTRASNTDKTRGPLFRPGEDAVARRA